MHTVTLLSTHDLVAHAIAQNVPLQFTYPSAEGVSRKRCAQACRFLDSDTFRALDLDAPDESAWRTFKVSRMTSAAIIEEPAVSEVAPAAQPLNLVAVLQELSGTSVALLADGRGATVTWRQTDGAKCEATGDDAVQALMRAVALERNLSA